MFEAAAVGCSAVAFAACALDRGGRGLVGIVMALMFVSMVVVTVLPGADVVIAASGIALWVLAAIVARQRGTGRESVRILRSATATVMGAQLVLHALGGGAAIDGNGHDHGVDLAAVTAAMVVALVASLSAMSLRARRRLDARAAVELWAGVLACVLMLAH